MRITFNELVNRFKSPDGFSMLFKRYLAANGARVSVEKTIAQASFFHAKAIGTNTTFFSGSTASSATNFTNLNDFVRNEGEHMMINSIQISTGVNAAITAVLWLEGAGTVANDNNGTLSLVNNGVTVLSKYDLGQFKTGLTTADDGVVNLVEPIIWRGQTPCEATIIVPAAPAANSCIKINYNGMALVS